ncbi:MAG: hypothetical protein HY894_07850 [Deltaproteobacteria bacterium]|nr:hypothetical protein [Deltaproteobacteria bacterium]
MKSSTGPKKRSRLQGHRRRRRVIKVARRPAGARLSPTEYKTLRQYPCMGDMLDAFRQYGLRAGVEEIARREAHSAMENGYGWLTEE